MAAKISKVIGVPLPVSLRRVPPFVGELVREMICSLTCKLMSEHELDKGAGRSGAPAALDLS
jgi:hypothetical protein